MDIEELKRRLLLSSIDIAEPTLRRWAAEGIIASPRRHSKGKGGGRGRVSDWPHAAVEEAAACWYLRHEKRTRMPPSVTVLKEVKAIAERLYESPMDEPYFEYPDLYALTVNWVCAIEKVRHGWPFLQPARVTLYWSCWGGEGASRRTSHLSDVTVEHADAPLKDEYVHNDVDFGFACNRIASLLAQKPSKTTYDATDARQLAISEYYAKYENLFDFDTILSRDDPIEDPAERLRAIPEKYKNALYEEYKESATQNKYDEVIVRINSVNRAAISSWLVARICGIGPGARGLRGL